MHVTRPLPAIKVKAHHLDFLSFPPDAQTFLAMSKRARDEDAQPIASASKRVKSFHIDHLSRLSDELILRVLSFLDVAQLAACQSLSSQYQSLAGDGQIWKAHYYNRFVRPRASRLPALKDAGASSQDLHFASRASRWLEDEHLVDGQAKTNWKRQYKLRHNWSRGSCAVNEVQVADNTPVPPILVQMYGGIIYMADQTDGLRAWAAKGERKLLARLMFAQGRPPPTSMTIDQETQNDDSLTRVMMGFEDGSFDVVAYQSSASRLVHLYSHPPSSNGVISAAALSWPYAVTMTATQRLSLYQFGHPVADNRSTTILDPPRLLHSLKSSTVWPPLAISLRTSGSNIVISVAYALPTYLSGWTVGIQEVKLSGQGEFLQSRIGSAIDQHYRPLAFSTVPMAPYFAPPGLGLTTSTTLEMRHIHAKPTSLSYTHPYLLVSHPDNTLALYLVTSTAESLHISAGSRLWGHTSSVSGAQVGNRGKAVSVSRRGDELRVWELEGGFASSAARKRLATGELSVQLRPELPKDSSSDTQAGLDLVSHAQIEQEDSSELTLTRGWIGFDEENVVVLKEQGQGKQALMIYDFT